MPDVFTVLHSNHYVHNNLEILNGVLDFLDKKNNHTILQDADFLSGQ